MIGSYTLSRTETNYEKEQWYQEILENGRKITCSTGIGTIFQEMTIYDNVQKYFYMGREILDYSGKNLGSHADSSFRGKKSGENWQQVW